MIYSLLQRVMDVTHAFRDWTFVFLYFLKRIVKGYMYDNKVFLSKT